MPTISRFYGMLVIMYYREGFNEEPHFHVRYNEYDAKFRIEDLEIINSYFFINYFLKDPSLRSGLTK